MKIILFNGPPKCGKDHAKLYLTKKHNTIPFEFKTRLFEITRAIYGVSEKQWNSWYTREGKEICREELYGLSCRQALIDTSENIIKVAFGKHFFGSVEAKKLHNIRNTISEGDTVVVFSDCGFNEEVEAFDEFFNPEDIFIVKIKRDGYSFSGDSRNWITTDWIPDSNYITIHNDGTEMFNTILDDTYNYIMSR